MTTTTHRRRRGKKKGCKKADFHFAAAAWAALGSSKNIRKGRMKSQFSSEHNSLQCSARPECHTFLWQEFRSRSVYLANKTKWLARALFSSFLAILALEHNKLK